MDVVQASNGKLALATRLAFFVAGFTVGCWAPLVPYAKANVGADERLLGFLLLSLGVGSLCAMPLTGGLSTRVGSKRMIIAGGVGVALLLPVLSLVASPAALAVTLFGFGACLGTLDVAMNVHAIETERIVARPLMSGFHGLYSVGGFVGAGLMTLLLSTQLSAAACSVACSIFGLAVLTIAAPMLLRGRHGEEGPLLALPRGIVLLLAVLAGCTFLVEGAMLDWSAVLIVTDKLVSEQRGGVGFMMFSVAMTIGRLFGDRIITQLGDFRVLVVGGLVAVAGLVVLLTVPIPAVALAGFVLIGLGASNVVPVLFSKAGSQTTMPTSLAVTAITTVGYAGILAGPASIGFIAHAVGLHTAFWMITALMACVPLCARFVAPVAARPR